MCNISVVLGSISYTFVIIMKQNHTPSVLCRRFVNRPLCEQQHPQLEDSACSFREIGQINYNRLVVVASH